MIRPDAPDGVTNDSAGDMSSPAPMAAPTNDRSKGVTVGVNGAGGPGIEGSGFAVALLALWLGATSPDEELRTGLLGGRYY